MKINGQHPKQNIQPSRNCSIIRYAQIKNIQGWHKAKNSIIIFPAVQPGDLTLQAH
jgi:hypothetical protein